MEAFKEKGLSDEILKAIGELGFETPTPIQAKIIPAILDSDQDMIGLAQTGTGKTAGFGLPILQKIDVKTKTVCALILSPTRELCLQITKDLQNYSKYINGMKVTAVYGGANIVPQINDLKRGVHVVVGTPGRTLDLINRKVLKLNNIKWLVLDEADEMLNMGFKEDLNDILSVTDENKQTLLFSATMPQDVRRIANDYMTDPEEIVAGKKNAGAENVEHKYYIVRAIDRYPALKRLADIHPNIYGIVFCRTRRETKEVADKLIQDGYNADALHGDLSQSQRDHVMARFRNGTLQLLIATDVAARGLDVDDLTHVINYNMPDDLEVYVHRSGRTGRAGKAGISISITHIKESRKIKELEKLTGKKFTYQEVPGGREICEKRLYSLIDKVENVTLDESQIETFLPVIYKKLEWLEREDLIKKFVSVEFNRFLTYYKNAKDLNVSKKDNRREDSRNEGRRSEGRREGRRDDRRDDRREGRREGRRDDSRRGSDENFSRFFINLGTANGLTVPFLIGLINDNTPRTRRIEIGKIDLLRNFSFFEVEDSAEALILKGFKDIDYKGIAIKVELSSADPHKDKGFSKKKKEKTKGSYTKEDSKRRRRRD